MSPAKAQLAAANPPPAPPPARPSVPSAAVMSLSSPSIGKRSNATGPDWLGRLPDEVWTLVFQHLAQSTVTCSSSLLDFLNHRLACKFFDHLIRSEQVAYTAVLAVNGNLLRDTLRAPLVKLTDIAESWWDVLLDQRRLDRVWLDGAVAAADIDGGRASEISPGYEVLLVDVESSSSKSKLSHYDWPSADISHSLSAGRDEGVLGFLAYRSHANDSDQPPLSPRSTSTGRRASASNAGSSSANNGTDDENASDDEYKEFEYITVHILDFPSLHPITTHVLMDRGFGSLDNNSDLTRTAHYPANPPTSSIQGSLSQSLSRPLRVTLGHLDQDNKLYSLICTDNWNNSIIHLRSYDCESSALAGVSAQSGRTVAAVHIASSCYVTHLYLIPSQPTILRMFYIHKNTRHLHLVDLCRTTLTLIHETIATHTETYYYDYNPVHQPDVFVLRPFTSLALVCDVRTGAILHRIKLPARTSAFGQKVHGMVYRPLMRPLEQGTARVVRRSVQSRPARADAGSAPDLARAQWTMEWVQGCEVGGDEDYLAKTSKCHARIVGVPAAPQALPHVFNEFVEPPVQSGDLLGAHVCAMFSPNGDVHVADLRRDACPEAEMRRVWSVGRRFTSSVRADSEVRIGTAGENVGGATGRDGGRVDEESEETFDVVVKRVGPTAAGRIMRANMAEGVARSLSAGLLDPESTSADKSDDSSDEDYSESDGAGAQEDHGSSGDESESESESEEDDDDAESSWDETGELIALGGRGNAFLVQRGPVIAILRRCMGE